MDDPVRQAERLSHAVRCCLASVEAARCRLVFDLREVEVVAALRGRRQRLEKLALTGSLGQALRDLEAEARADATEPLT